jgi:hypothetical protein
MGSPDVTEDSSSFGILCRDDQVVLMTKAAPAIDSLSLRDRAIVNRIDSNCAQSLLRHRSGAPCVRSRGESQRIQRRKRIQFI